VSKDLHLPNITRR